MFSCKRRFTVIVSGIIVSVAPLFALCVEKEQQQSQQKAKITFSKDIAPIVFENCATCHRPGEVAPFSLLTYDDVHKRAEQIQQVTEERFMPPWKSVEGHGSFLDERRLTAAQIELIRQWVEQGAAEGDPQDLPPLPAFPSGWKLGEPDMVITMSEPFAVPAEGEDVYQNFVMSLDIPAGKFIKAVEYKPQNRRVVHHATLSMEVSGESRRKDAEDPQPGFRGSLNIPGRLLPGSTGIWTPGREAAALPSGLSLPWPKGADLILQLHLHPSGKSETEQSSIGVFLTDEAPTRSTVDIVLVDRNIDIGPGMKEYRTRDELVLPIASRAICIFPHMHLIGREIKVTAYPPLGDPIPLLWISDWDFNWQSFYQYAEPIELPKGTRLKMEALHDNSAENVRNPSNPPQRVTWGEQTTNEMSVAIVTLEPANEKDVPTIYEDLGPRVLGGITAESIQDQAKAKQMATVLGLFDKNKDQKISYDELAQVTGADKQEIEKRVARFDADGDGLLNVDEIAVAMEALRGS